MTLANVQRLRPGCLPEIHKDKKTECENYRGISLVPRRQSASQGDRQETERVLREKGTAAEGTEWVSPISIDHRHDVCGSPTAGTRAEGRGTALPLLHRHPKGL